MTLTVCVELAVIDWLDDDDDDAVCDWLAVGDCDCVEDCEDVCVMVELAVCDSLAV